MNRDSNLTTRMRNEPAVVENHFRSRVLGFVLLLVYLTACQPVVAKKFDVEYISQAQQNNLDISSTPTSFIVPFGEEVLSWERAQYFAKHYAIDSKTKVDEYTGESTLQGIFKSKNYDRIAFKISQDLVSRKGYQVRIEASSKIIPPDRLLFWRKNVARFVKDGILEKSLF